MSEQLRESLSALLDGEASRFEVRRVLEELQRNPQLQEACERFVKASAAMQGARTRDSMADAVWARLQAAPAEPHNGLGGAKGLVFRRRRLLASAAALTLVAMAAILGVNFGGPSQSAPPEVAVTPAMEVARAPAVEVWQVEAALPDRRWVEAYLIQHMQHKAVSQPDVAAFTKLVTYEPGADGP